MNKVITNIIALLLSVAAMAQEKKVAVFDPTGDATKSIMTIIREEISTIIVNADGYTALEREQIERVIKEYKFQASGMVEDSQIIEAGKLMGANMVFVTNVTNASGGYHISCKLIDMATARIEKQRTFQTQNVTEIRDAIKRNVGDMFGLKVKLTASALVADGRKVFSDGQKLRKREVRQEMTNTDALRVYNKGISKNRNGNIWLVTGLLVSAGGVYTALTAPLDEQYEFKGEDGNQYYGYHENLNLWIGGAATAAGMVMSVTGIILKVRSKNLIEQSVNMYNSSSKNRANVEWEFEFTGNRVSLVFKF